MSANEIPNKEWYARFSQSRASAAHCPFATVEACPRYYQSLSLLGEAGSTKIPEKEDWRLLKHWKKSDLWPRTEEQLTRIAGATFSNFCPEVTAKRFGYFATYLTRYADELDIGHAHKRLAREDVPAGHPSRSWSSCVPQHFTECPVYAEPQPWWREHLGKIVVGIVVAIFTAIIKLFL